MDTRLQERLQKWHDQIPIVHEAELDALRLEAEEKPFFSALFNKATGKTVAEREHEVCARSDWKDFCIGVALARAKANHEKRILEHKMKAYEAEYISFKMDSEAIKRAG